MLVPEELHYTEEHEWAQVRDGGILRVGITDYAQDALGDIVFIDVPDAGTEVEARSIVVEVESTKSVGEVYAPCSGTVVSVNEALRDHPELVNSSPYGDGWMVEIEPAGGFDVASLLDAAAYRKLTE